MLTTGARPGEICDAQWEEIDLHTGVLVRPVGKNGRPRVIHLTGSPKAILSTIPRKSEYLFPAFANRPSSARTHSWGQLCSEAGVEGLQLRDLRRSYGTDLRNRGLSLELVGAALGHASLTTTERVYAHLRDSTVAAALERLDEMEAPERDEAAG
jgi:integrase